MDKTCEFAFINLFRAGAAFWVLGAHCMIWGGWTLTSIPDPKRAVDLFMLISGFLMAANAHARHQVEPLTSCKNWMRFWLRRFFRLAPAYYLSLLLAVATSAYFLSGYHHLFQALQARDPQMWVSGGGHDPLEVQYTLVSILLHLTFLFGLHPRYSYSTFLPDWSLSLEMQFYFVFPILLLVMYRLGVRRIALTGGLVAYLLGVVVARFIHFGEPSFLFFKLHYFLAGMLVYWSLTDANRGGRSLSLYLCALVLISFDIHQGWLFLSMFGILSALFALGWLEVRNKMPRPLEIIMVHRATRFYADISYGMYLFHGFFIALFGLLLAQSVVLQTMDINNRVLVMFPFVFLGTLGWAYVVYRLVELPGIQIGRRVIQRLPKVNA